MARRGVLTADMAGQDVPTGYTGQLVTQQYFDFMQALRTEAPLYPDSNGGTVMNNSLAPGTETYWKEDFSKGPGVSQSAQGTNDGKVKVTHWLASNTPMQKNYEEVFEFTGPCGIASGIIPMQRTERIEYRKSNRQAIEVTNEEDFYTMEPDQEDIEWEGGGLHL